MWRMLLPLLPLTLTAIISFPVTSNACPMDGLAGIYADTRNLWIGSLVCFSIIVVPLLGRFDKYHAPRISKLLRWSHIGLSLLVLAGESTNTIGGCVILFNP